MSKNYIHYNLQCLRKKLGMSREEFGTIFDLTGANIKSYENGVSPKISKYLEITKHFRIDPEKFKEFDMETYDISKTDDIEANRSVLPSKKVDITEYIPESKQYNFIENTPHDTLLKLCKNLLRHNDELTLKLEDNKSLIIELQKQVIELQQSKKEIS